MYSLFNAAELSVPCFTSRADDDRITCGGVLLKIIYLATNLLHMIKTVE